MGDQEGGKPLAIDLFCGLGGWTEGLLAEGYYVGGFDIACRRIEEAYRQPRLFEEPPAKPVQAALFDGDAA